MLTVTRMVTRMCVAAVLSLGWLLGWADAADPDAGPVPQVVAAAGVKGGLIVHLGCGDGQLTAALRVHDGVLVHGLDADAADIEKARQYLRERGLYGPVSVDRWNGPRLPYIDNLVNLMVVSGSLPMDRDEILRVLCPGGVAVFTTDHGQLTTDKLIKPRPAEMDEWTHYLHDPSNNAVAHDALVGPPRRLQWICGPNWSRHHDHMASLSAMVSAKGRVFYIMDEGPREAILLPPQWMLIARDAFNGTLLWKRPIAEWNTHLWPLKSGPNQLPRRLVAVGDRVYVTLGIDAPLTVLDAATGETLKTYESTEHTDEILADAETLFLLVGQGPNKWKDYRPKHTYVWDNTTRANRDWAWDQANRWLMAVRADTGAVLWKQEQRVAPLTLAVDRDRVFFYNGEKAVCLNRLSGETLWTSEPVVRKLPFPTGYGPTLVVQHDVVLLSVENRSMTAISATDGKTLWTAPHHPGGHASPDDLLVINGLVWSGAVASGQNTGVFTGRDVQTGEVKCEFPPDVSPDWFHHRCYRSRATDQYFIASRTGIEFIDLQAQHWDINHWVRSGCLYGFMPCNGLLYTTPHACGCFLESKLFGLNALAPEPSPRVKESKTRKVEESQSSRVAEWQSDGDAGRLERGPAYADSGSPLPALGSPLSADWPTYRHDASRSGSVKTMVPAELKQVWQAELGGKLTGVVVADGKVFVASVDTHTVRALDAGTGQAAWSHTVGGRVDSPPTIYEGRVLLGSADGWVYCLRASDGQLAWRFRAAPEDRRLIAYEQLESAWPVSGSVLVHNDTVYCVAGRSAFLDGGMRLIRLDPKTGRKLSETSLDDRDPESGENLQRHIQGQDMPVALPDILSCDGRSVYMRTQAFDLEGVRQRVAPVKLGSPARRRGDASAAEEQPEIGDHLFSRTGFLDDSWYFRSYWIYGTAVDSNYGGWLRPGHFAPCGRLMVFDEACVYGFDRKPEYLCNSSVQEYYLYGADRQVSDEAIQRVRAATGRIDAASTSKSASSSDWLVRKKFSLTEQNVANFKWAEGNPPIQARALVLADQTLFVAGPPDVLNEEAAFQNPDDPAIQAQLAVQAAALKGRHGAQILAISAVDGKLLAARELGAMPTFDGMAAAQGKLYVTTVDGRVLCLGGEGKPLPAAGEPKLAPLDISVKPVPPEPTSEPSPSRAGDFARVERAAVTRSDLGYHVRAEDKKTGLVLKKLPAPLQGKVELRAKLKCTAAGAIRNGFLVFGETPEENSLVKCGPRIRMKKAVIVQGPVEGGTAAEKELELDENQVYEITVTIDVASGQVTMALGGATVTATLDPKPASIAYVGYQVLNAATDFGPIEISPQ